MNQKINFKFDDSGIRNLIKALESPHVLRVGIFGGAHNKESGKDSLSNADIGMLAEFGTESIGGKSKRPARSWLRDPIIKNMTKMVTEAKAKFEQSAKDGNSIAFLKYLGTRAEAYIKMAFEQGGPGWPANSPATLAYKKRMGYGTRPNIATGQLMDSIASQVI
jgi:hypothetical protein